MVYGDFDRRLERVVNRIEKTVPAEDKKVLFDFLKQAEADGISTPRQERLLDIMRSIREEIGKHFSEITKDDLLLLVGRWEKRQKAGKLTAWSTYTFRAVVKKFFKWYKGNNEIYPEEVRWMKNGMKDVNRKVMNQNELISETDILKIITSTPSIRDKAFIGTLYDSGGRPKEVVTLKFGDVIIDDKVTQIRIREGKTGQRIVNLVIFPQYLMMWMNQHPSQRPSDPLWVNTSNYKSKGEIQGLSYGAANKIVKTAIERAGLHGKKLNMYNFRHSRGTQLARAGASFDTLQKHLGHHKAQTTMIYLHLNDADYRREMNKLHGIPVDEEEPSDVLSPKKCPKCKKSNAPNIKFCGECGTILDVQEAIAADEKKMNLLKRIVREELDKEPKRWEKVQKSLD